MATALALQARNIFGPLKPELRARLERVLSAPSQEAWDDAYTLVVAPPSTTLWQAWIAVDPQAVRSKPCDDPWPRVPDQFTLYRALRYATQEPTP